MTDPDTFWQARGATREEDTDNRILQPRQVRDALPVERPGGRDVHFCSRRQHRQVQPRAGIAEIQHPLRRKLELARRLLHHGARVDIAHNDLGLDQADEVDQLRGRRAGTCGRVDAAGGDGAKKERLQHIVPRRHGQHIVRVWALAANAVRVAEDMC